MIKLDRNLSEVDLPLTWGAMVLITGTVKGIPSLSSRRRRSAIVVCANGHSSTLDGHEISSDGLVSPSVVCPHEGCGWHEYIRLMGWETG